MTLCLSSALKNLRLEVTICDPEKKEAATPYGFTEQGIAMLSSVLKSTKAVSINIAIMRAFVQMRQVFASHKALEEKLKALQEQSNKHDRAIVNILQFLQSEVQEQKPRKSIGFNPN